MQVKICTGLIASTNLWPERCLLFLEKACKWSCLKAVLVPTFVIAGLLGSIATSGSCFLKDCSLHETVGGRSSQFPDLWSLMFNGTTLAKKKNATWIMHKTRTLFVSRNITRLARWRGWPRLLASLHRSAVKLDFSISHDRNSVLILCIIQVAFFSFLFFGQGRIFIFTSVVNRLLHTRCWRPQNSKFCGGSRLIRQESRPFKSAVPTKLLDEGQLPSFYETVYYVQRKALMINCLQHFYHT